MSCTFPTKQAYFGIFVEITFKFIRPVTPDNKLGHLVAAVIISFRYHQRPPKTVFQLTKIKIYSEKPSDGHILIL